MKTEIAVKLDSRSTKVDGSHPIKLYLAHEGKGRFIGLKGASCTLDQWNDVTSSVKGSENGSGKLNGKIQHAQEKSKQVLEHYDRVGLLNDASIAELKTSIQAFLASEKMEYSFSDGSETKQGKGTGKSNQSFVAYRDHFDSVTRPIHLGTANNVKYDTVAFIQFLETSRIKKRLPKGKFSLLREITPEILELYKGYLKQCGYTGSGPYTKFQRLKALFNHAIKNRVLARDLDPFENVRFPPNPKGKNNRGRAAREKQERYKYFENFRTLPLQEGSNLWHHRNQILFMWDCSGMNYTDLVLLKKEQVDWDYGEFSYYRFKNRQHSSQDEIVVTLVPEAKSILRYYYDHSISEKGTIFPIIEDKYDWTDDLQAFKYFYEYKLKKLNGSLATLCHMISMPKITCYDIRRIYAEHQKELATDESVRQVALGHSKRQMSEQYEGKVTLDVLHEANLKAVHSDNALQIGNGDPVSVIKAEVATKQAPIKVQPKESPGAESYLRLKSGKAVTTDDFILSVLPQVIGENGVSRAQLIVRFMIDTELQDGIAIGRIVDDFLAK
jgi:integrase